MFKIVIGSALSAGLLLGATATLAAPRVTGGGVSGELVRGGCVDCPSEVGVGVVIDTLVGAEGVLTTICGDKGIAVAVGVADPPDLTRVLLFEANDCVNLTPGFPVLEGEAVTCRNFFDSEDPLSCNVAAVVRNVD